MIPFKIFMGMAMAPKSGIKRDLGSPPPPPPPLIRATTESSTNFLCESVPQDSFDYSLNSGQ